MPSVQLSYKDIISTPTLCPRSNRVSINPFLLSLCWNSKPPCLRTRDLPVCLPRVQGWTAGGSVLEWSRNVLSKALLAAPALATTCLLPAVTHLVAGLHRRSDHERVVLQNHIWPFLTFALLYSKSGPPSPPLPSPATNLSLLPKVCERYGMEEESGESVSAND